MIWAQRWMPSSSSSRKGETQSRRSLRRFLDRNHTDQRALVRPCMDPSALAFLTLLVVSVVESVVFF
jgi:hypothetical protein